MHVMWRPFYEVGKSHGCGTMQPNEGEGVHPPPPRKMNHALTFRLLLQAWITPLASASALLFYLHPQALITPLASASTLLYSLASASSLSYSTCPASFDYTACLRKHFVTGWVMLDQATTQPTSQLRLATLYVPLTELKGMVVGEVEDLETGGPLRVA